MIDRASWARLKELFFSASELRGEERARYLEGLSSEEPELVKRLHGLLVAHDRTAGFVEAAVREAAGAIVGGAGLPTMVGRRVGPYEIVGLLGRGGMGTVFLARRADGAFDKQVAVKLVGTPLASEELFRRFAVERQALAQFEHPNIARLLDGGATSEGFPYLVMEYVEGMPIDRYCTEKGCGLEERLGLFLDACAAVQHAHRNLVVHRDIKPSNILVTTEGEVKLLDFGIAKLLSVGAGQAPHRTRTTQAALTPEYASPEQIRGGPITTATDVYALGILLYRLLTRAHPYSFPDDSLASAHRVICEVEPEPPSEALARLARAEGAVEAARTARRVAGDLDNIVLKALQKQPERRYGTVEQLAEDLRRHLGGLPVTARGDSLRYRSSKFIRRHRLGVAAGTLVLLSLVGGVAATAWQAERARQQARLAKSEQAKAEEISTFLQDMLGAADASWYASGRGKGSKTTIAEVLDRAAERAGTDFPHRPELEASVRVTLGKTYRSLGLLDASERQLRRAVALERDLVGEHHPEFADASRWLALTLSAEGKLDEAEPMMRLAIATLRLSMPERAEVLAGAINDLGLMLWQRGDAGKAEPLFEEAIELSRRYLDERSSIEPNALGNLGLIHDLRGDMDGAEAYYRRALAALERIPGPPFIERGLAKANIATVLRVRGQYPEAEGLYREALSLLEQILGADDVTFVAPLWSNLADLHRLEGRAAQAEQEIVRVLGVYDSRLPRDHPYYAWAEFVHGLILTDTGRAVEGEGCLRRAVDISRHAFKAGDRRTASTVGALGHCLATQKRYAEAEPLLLEGYEGIKRASGEKYPRTRQVEQWLVSLYEGWGRLAKAAGYRAHLEKTAPPGNPAAGS